VEHIDIEIINRQDCLIIRIKYDNIVALSFNYDLNTHDLELASHTYMYKDKTQHIIRLYTYDGGDVNVYKHILSYFINEVINKHEQIINDIDYIYDVYIDELYSNLNNILNYKTNKYTLIKHEVINKTNYKTTTTYKIRKINE